MISKSEVLKMARSIFRGKGGKMQHPVVEPWREWFIGIGFFALIITIGGMYTANKYQYYSNIESTIDTTTKAHKKYDQNSAELALSIFSERKSVFTSVANAPVVIAPVVQASSTEQGTSTEAVSGSTDGETESTVEHATSSTAE